MEQKKFQSNVNLEDSKEELPPSMAGLLLDEAIRELNKNKELLDDEGLDVLDRLKKMDEKRKKEIFSKENIQDRVTANLKFLEEKSEEITLLHTHAKELLNK